MKKSTKLSKRNMKISGGGIWTTLNKLIVPLGLTLAAKHLSKRKIKRKNKSKKTIKKTQKTQKGGFIRGGSDQFFYNGHNCNAKN